MRKRIILSDRPKSINGKPINPRDMVKWRLTKQTEYPVAMFKNNIKEQIKFNGNYSPNIINSQLMMCADLHGYEVANKVIRDMGLDQIGWKEEVSPV
jgi:hypothetical protein